MLVNVVDVPSLCNFILPAIVRTGPLAIAISTAGASPALAKRIKREIAAEYGEPYARLAVILNDARGWAKATLPTYQDRKEFFEGIVNGDPDPVELVRDGRERDVLELIEAAKAHPRQPAPRGDLMPALAIYAISFGVMLMRCPSASTSTATTRRASATSAGPRWSSDGRSARPAPTGSSTNGLAVVRRGGRAGPPPLPGLRLRVRELSGARLA